MRWKFMFWLDDLKSDELELIQEIDQLKAARSFVSSVRDGLRLIIDLRSGRTDILFDLFPLLKDRLLPTPASGGSGEGFDELKAMLELALSHTHRDEKLMSGAGGLKQIAAPILSRPVFDDDDDGVALVVTKAANSCSSANFIKMAS